MKSFLLLLFLSISILIFSQKNNEIKKVCGSQAPSIEWNNCLFIKKSSNLKQVILLIYLQI